MNDKILNQINEVEQIISDSHQSLWISTKWKKRRMKDILHILKEIRWEQIGHKAIHFKRQGIKDYSDEEYQDLIDNAMKGGG